MMPSQTEERNPAYGRSPDTWPKQTNVPDKVVYVYASEEQDVVKEHGCGLNNIV